MIQLARAYGISTYENANLALDETTTNEVLLDFSIFAHKKVITAI